MDHKAMLISIEGIDGSGKSTLAKQLANALEQLGKKVLLTKEPGGSLLGKELRRILQTQEQPITGMAEFLLFAADRAQHFHEIILPKLCQGTIIISDRMADSSLVYQGYGRGLNLEMITTINNWAMRGIKPDLTFYVKVDIACALERIAQRKEQTAFEKEQEGFVKKVMEGFDIIFKNRENVITLDGTEKPSIVTNSALQAIEQWLNSHNNPTNQKQHETA